MKTIRCSVALVLAVLIAVPAAQAQTHVIGRGALDQAIADRASRDQADRAVILSVLRRAEVKDVAETAGLSIDKAEAAVSLLEGSGLEQAAAHARQVQSDLAGGGSTVVISTTTIIIVLLLVILIVLIAN